MSTPDETGDPAASGEPLPAGPVETDLVLLEASLNEGIDALVASLSDVSVPQDVVKQQFREVLLLRRRLANPDQAAGNADAGSVQVNQEEQQRRDSLARLIGQLLAAAPNRLLHVGELCSDPRVKEARAGGTAKYFAKFLAHYPEVFELMDVPNSHPGKPPVKCVLLKSMPATLFGQQKSRKRKAGAAGMVDPAVPQPEEVEAARAAILAWAVEVVTDAGGELSLTRVCQDPRISEARKGAVSSMSKFLAKHSEAFELFDAPAVEEGKCATPMVRLLPGATALVPSQQKRPRMKAPAIPAAAATPASAGWQGGKGGAGRGVAGKGGAALALPGWTGKPVAGNGPRPPAFPPPSVAKPAQQGLSPQEAEGRRRQLVQHVQRLLLEVPEGSLRIDDLSHEPTVQVLRQGAVAKLANFLEKQEGVFSVYEAEDGQGRLCKCVCLAL